MPKMKLTAAAIEKLNAPSEGRVEYWDATLPGFGLRITCEGRRTWTAIARLHGKQVRMSFGTFPKVGLADAREAARTAFQAIDRGEDPRIERKERKHPDLVEDVVKDFIARHIDKNLRPRSAAEARRPLDRYVIPKWGSRPIKSIARRDVLDLLDDIVDEDKPIAANRALAAIRKLFNWCCSRDILESSPVAGVTPPSKESKRERVLTEDEIQTVWKACDAIGYPFGAYFKMLLVTGQRRNEVATMRWQDIDLDKGLWTLPRERVKADRVHEVPLSPVAVSILEALPRVSAYVFSSRTAAPKDAKEKDAKEKDQPISGYSKAKAKLDKQIAAIVAAANPDAEAHDGVTWRIHDLRRTVGTHMARLGVDPYTISRVLNHAEGGVTHVYRRYSYLDEKRRALDTWGRALEAMVGLLPSNVTPLKAEARA